MITPQHILTNDLLFQQEHRLNQKLSRELRRARRELKREAYFASLQISKLTEQTKSAKQFANQGTKIFYGLYRF